MESIFKYKTFCSIIRNKITYRNRSIFQNKNNIKFLIVVMEDDVYRNYNFNKYWNQLLNLTDCDYVAF